MVRLFRRLFPLRGWSHEEVREVSLEVPERAARLVR